MCFLYILTCVYLLFKKRTTFTWLKNLLDPYLSLCFPTENLREEWHLPLHSNSMFSVKLAILTCNKHCQYRDCALLQWQRRAGSGTECSLGWMVVLQAPGKLLSQYHFQYVVFSEALTKKKLRLKHSLFTIFNYLFLIIINYCCSIFLFQVILQAENWNSWGFIWQVPEY